MPRLRHPRAVLLFKVALYLATAVALTALVLTGAGFLGMVAVAGLTAAVFDVAAGGALLPILLLGISAFALLGGGLVIGARRIERYVVAYDREPEPLEALKRRYVEADIDEPELERRLEALLADGDDSVAAGESPVDDRRGGALARGGAALRDRQRPDRRDRGRSSRRGRWSDAEEGASAPIRE